MAKERVKAICHPYLQAIKNHENQEGHDIDQDKKKIVDAWQIISGSDFHLSDEYPNPNEILSEQLIENGAEAAFRQCLLDKVETVVYNRDRMDQYMATADEIVSSHA